MDWQAAALILHRRLHGEAGVIAEVFSEAEGRYAGFIAGGNSRKMRPLIQPGNLVFAEWRARLSEQLGSLKIEAGQSFAATAMAEPLALAGLNTLVALLRILPERHPYPRLYQLAHLSLAHIVEPDIWLALFARFELTLLEETGFGLDLSECAVTGTDDLAYVSPRSGRAVSYEGAGKWRDRLLPLPDFLRDHTQSPSRDDIRTSLALTGYFLEHRLYRAQGGRLPATRAQICALI